MSKTNEKADYFLYWVGHYIYNIFICICKYRLSDKSAIYNKKLAVIEFAIIGIPSFYLATIMVMPYFILSVVGYENMNYPIPMWAVYGQTPMVLGGVIFGYELFAFITKMIKFKRITTSENE